MMKKGSSIYGFVRRLSLVLCYIFALAPLGCGAEVERKNGFDLSKASIKTNKILSGGPPRDGIPSIDHPKFIATDQVDYLKDEDLVLGFVHGDTARAYPLRILVWHEIVNDVIEDYPIVVTYCPLCGTGMIFERRVDEVIRSFGVSGLLYQSDVLMYDRESDSLWSQLLMKGVSGPSVGQALTWLASEHISWGAWKEKFPHGEVLSMDTGQRRNYQVNAYASYFSSAETMFPVPRLRDELPNKAWVVGILIDGKAKAYPVRDLPSNRVFKDRLGKTDLLIRYDAANQYPQIKDAHGVPIPSVRVFWFAWQAFYPHTELWEP